MNRKQARKKVDEWKSRKPPEVPKGDVERVLDAFFPRIEKEKGSHLLGWQIPQEIRQRVEMMTGQSVFAPDGSFSIPIKSGKTVKIVYVRQGWMIIDQVKDEPNDDSSGTSETPEEEQGLHH